jgi:hypothetical protein
VRRFSFTVLEQNNAKLELQQFANGGENARLSKEYKKNKIIIDV